MALGTRDPVKPIGVDLAAEHRKTVVPNLHDEADED